MVKKKKSNPVPYNANPEHPRWKLKWLFVNPASSLTSWIDCRYSQQSGTADSRLPSIITDSPWSPGPQTTNDQPSIRDRAVLSVLNLSRGISHTDIPRAKVCYSQARKKKLLGTWGTEPYRIYVLITIFLPE